MQQLLLENQWLIWILIIWILPWKGVALWKAAKKNHTWWFTAMFVINTLAILEILYIFVFSRPRKQLAPNQQ